MDNAAPTSCRHCPARQHCLPAGLGGQALRRFEQLVHTSPLTRHTRLLSKGMPFSQLYAVREGQFKTESALPAGGVQVTGWYLPGQLLGLDGLGRHQHSGDTSALCDSVVCAMPFAALSALMAQDAALMARFHQLLGDELAHRLSTLLMLGTARALQRMAAFLLELAGKQAGAGEATLRLYMSREEIGAYLGLAVESISRQLGHLREEGLIRVSNRDITLLDLDRLRAVAAQADP